MKHILTPFGEIKILIDDEPVDYFAQEGRKLDFMCPDVLGRFQIKVQFIPDGKEHTIACIFESNSPYNRSHERGERLECQGFYNNQRFKMSIGVECDNDYIDEIRLSNIYDYDTDYLENGMAYIILPNTKTEQYTFGVSWIDDVGWDDIIDNQNDRDTQTWFGADPLNYL